MFKVFKKEIEVAGKKIKFETGKIARQADGAIIATSGETVDSANPALVIPNKNIKLTAGVINFFINFLT